jgi:hypothetical protein
MSRRRLPASPPPQRHRAVSLAARVIPAGAGRVRDYVGPLTWGADHARTADRRCAVHSADHGGRSGRDQTLAPQQRPAPGTRQRARGCRWAGWRRDGATRDSHRARFQRHRAARPWCPGAGAAGAGGAPADQAGGRFAAWPTRSRATAQWPAGHRQGRHHQRTDRLLLRSGRQADGRLPDGTGLDPPAPPQPAAAGSGRAHQAASATKRRQQAVSTRRAARHPPATDRRSERVGRRPVMVQQASRSSGSASGAARSSMPLA